MGESGSPKTSDAADDLRRVCDEAHQADRLDRAAALQGDDRGVLGERAAERR